MRAKTQIFSIIAGEAQANPDTMTSTMLVLGTPAQVLFDSRSSKFFVSSAFSLHVDRELAPLKNKLVVTTLSREKILWNFVLKGCEILVDVWF